MGVRIKNLYNKKNAFEYEEELFTSLLIVLFVGFLTYTVISWINGIFFKINGMENISAIVSIVLMMLYVSFKSVKLNKETNEFVS